MRTWIKIGKEYINLSTASSIEEAGEKGRWICFYICHGNKSTAIQIPADVETNWPQRGSTEEKELYREVVKIRHFLHDNQMRDTGGAGDRSGDY
jgi:hypothetical protein